MQILLMGIWMRSGISLWLWIGEDSAWLDVGSTICLSPLKSNNQSVCLFFQVISTLDAVPIRSGKNLQSNIHLNSNRFLFSLFSFSLSSLVSDQESTLPSILNRRISLFFYSRRTVSLGQDTSEINTCFFCLFLIWISQFLYWLPNSLILLPP